VRNRIPHLVFSAACSVVTFLALLAWQADDPAAPFVRVIESVAARVAPADPTLTPTAGPTATGNVGISLTVITATPSP